MIPSRGEEDSARCTVVSNHPLGGIDGIVIIAMLNECFGDRRRLLAIKGLAPVCIPVNKMGGQAFSLPETVRKAYDSPDQMLVFPAGACSRKIDGRIQDYPWNKLSSGCPRKTKVTLRKGR